MSAFYIMKALHLTSSGRKLGLAKIMRDEPNCTLIVGTRHYGYGKEVGVFIIGSQGEYGVKKGDKSTYTIDTGNGYRNQNERLDIHHVLQITNGAVVEYDGSKSNLDKITPLANQYTFVMK